MVLIEKKWRKRRELKILIKEIDMYFELYSFYFILNLELNKDIKCNSEKNKYKVKKTNHTFHDECPHDIHIWNMRWIVHETNNFSLKAAYAFKLFLIFPTNSLSSIFIFLNDLNINEFWEWFLHAQFRFHWSICMQSSQVKSVFFNIKNKFKPWNFLIILLNLVKWINFKTFKN
jgi:hypothetical protein